ncbi:DUF481 domain-containing protein [Marinimicrobium agarilyticum]|uniref:DUF481 domain-containing protein n=1 Tax=Marinimicrobium agarilyticum TaxID=306546 RepID=UPI00040F9228|nr:DUF481 domain-containing protein [Marinimicrobium agarilyticum]
MKAKLTTIAASLVALSAAPGVVAQDEQKGTWKASAEVGAISTSGNTESTTFNGKLDAAQDLERWKNQYTLNILYSEDEVAQPDGSVASETTAEKFSGSVKSAYKINRDNANLFVFASHTDDEFGAYQKYTTLALGYGNRLFETDTMQLDAEIGPGYYWAEEDTVDGVIEEDGALLRAAAQFDWQVSPTADFKQVLSTESGEENTRTVSDTSLALRINGSMQMKVGYTIQHDSDVGPEKENTDTTTYVNLVYKF